MVLSMLSMFLRDRTQHSRGFSSIEVLLASSIFILLMTSLTGAYFYGREATTLASKRAQATLLAEEGLEVVRNIRDKDFGILNDGTHGLRLAGNNRWVFSNNANETDGFTREIVIDAVDPKRKDVTANVTWEQNPQRTGLVSLMTRLTNWTEADPPPAAPTNLVATAGNRRITLNWTANTEPDLAGYRIFRSTTSGGPFNEIAGPQTQTTYIDNGLNNSATYYYVVQAQDDAGSLSPNSNQVSATIRPTERRCFIAGTSVIMSDGTSQSIENVKIGDYLLGKNGAINKVLDYERPRLGSRKLYSINDGPFFITAAHPLLTTTGWKSIDINSLYAESPALVDELKISALMVGDTLVTADGKSEVIYSIEGKSSADQQLFNFVLSGDRTYYVDGFLTHNEFSVDEY